ncbi:hypothetical protein G7Z17_g8039 [Cylindrodendrum hubeiense]|uniref:ABC transporter domain-containing protein n=1 Tax=Cylindrodendrum hubeiense TaxID=595255 RepID=A0A9P5H757_9HYPO|nr:hypothetical protein G7Z17_g8039 [Cylindrodendrum hubeiense]
MSDTIDPASMPQDPYLPQEDEVKGPIFLDTQACLCAMQTLPSTGSSKDTAAWQCIGNQTQSVYDVTSGKWFNTLHGGDDVDLYFTDDSNGPDTTEPKIWSTKSKSLKEFSNEKSLSVYDRACTGKNNTDFSTSYYQAAIQMSNGDTPIAATPCWRPGAYPMQLQGVDSWLSNGCSEGFLCMPATWKSQRAMLTYSGQNNTINSLPLFCPPISQCQVSRLAGMVCALNGRNIGMGPFEPIVCQQGWYCPPSAKGKKTIRCPAGSYCQPGASTPTPCSFGSRCLEGSSYQLYLIPIVVLIIVDVLLVAGIFFVKFRNRFHSSSRAHISSLKAHKGMSGVTARVTGYKALSDETDQEMVPMNPPTYLPRSETWTGFQEAFDAMDRNKTDRSQAEAGLSPHLRAFIESMRRATEATNFGLSFSYADLMFHPKGSPRPILQNVTGSIERGSLVAVMGGSGAGKSTFVNVLMGKTSNTGGLVSVNNIPGKMKKYKKLTGYVPQDDIVLPELTVYENIMHSARIRLPRTWSDADIRAHVESVVDCLELSHVRDSLVGSVGKPVISGGQRKRVSIGMELAAAPMAIFLDEPTSGLDATAASSIMQTLKAIARLGISIIVIIHQPRTEIFELFDNLILLGNGQTIYEGPQIEATPYFEGVGFHFPQHCNHADVITDIITGNGRDYKSSGDISKEALISHWGTWRQSRGDANKRNTTASILGGNTMHQALKKRGAPRIKQGWLCLRRAFLQQYRAKGAFWAEMGLATLAGGLLGLAENPKKGVLFVGLFNEPYGVLSTAMDFKSAPELALLMAIAIGLVAGAPGVKIFSEETLLYRREAEAGHSRLAYFLAKIICVLPRMALGCLHFTTLVLLLSTPIIDWGIAFLVNLMYFYCIYGLASCVSMVVRREDAPLFATMISLIVGILSGAAPPLAQVKEWHIEWLWRASPGVWLAELYFGQLVAPFEYLFNVKAAADVTGFHLDWKWINILVLLGIGTIYRVLAYIGMLVGHRLRR